MPLGVRVKLCAMMFLQYAIHAVWVIQMAAYLDGVLNCTGRQTSWVLNAVPLGALLAPIFVGMVADRFFAGEKVLAVLNLLGAALLLWAANVANPLLLFVVLLVQQLLYMPTWAITNSIAIANCADTEKDLPGIRVWGSIGWVATALFGIVASVLKTPWDGTHLPLLGAAALSVVAGLFAFALPHTPPPAAGKKAALGDILGLKALALLKNPSFAVFIVVSLLAMIPFAAYWSFFSLYLSSLGTGIITGTMNLGQFIEIFVMWLLLPLALKKLGIKWTLVLGVAILGLRYLMFMFADGDKMMFLNYGGILVHGFIFSFFFITGYIYADRVAPKEIRAQGQALIMLVTFGAGMLLGNWINGEIVDANAIPGERVAAGYTLPAPVPTEATLGIEGAKATDSVAYSRALSDEEFSLLVAEQQKKHVLVERLKKEFGDRVDLANGKLSAPAEAKAFTFSTWLELPKPKEGEAAKPLSGAIVKIGEGENAAEVGLDAGRLSLRAGKTKLTQVSPLPLGEKLHVAATFDGETLKLYTGGKLYKRWDWRTVWTYPAVISAALLLLMLFFFRVPPAKKEEPASA